MFNVVDINMFTLKHIVEILSVSVCVFVCVCPDFTTILRCLASPPEEKGFSSLMPR